jgi:predicted DNA-binding transcriptional regulator AlpA
LSSGGLSRDELLQLPAVVDLPVAARALGLGRSKAYDLAKTNRFPCEVIRLGKSYRVPTAGLLRILGIAPHSNVTTPADAPDRSRPADLPR